MKFGIGQAVARTEDARLLTGGGRYTDDLAEKTGGAAHAVFVRSPFAHARITSLDVEAAREVEGVLGVWASADLRAAGIGDLPCSAPVLKNDDGSDARYHPRPPLAEERVRFVGEPVVMIVAETLAAARDAAELVSVDYETLDAAVDTYEAGQPGSPLVHDDVPGNLALDWTMGSSDALEQAIGAADRVIRFRLINNRVVPNSMETRNCIAEYEPGRDRISLTVGSQGVHGMQKVLAQALGRDPDTIRVVTGDVGGGFGMKIFLYHEYVCTAFAAQALGRPVRWTSDRAEAFISDAHGRDHVSEVTAAVRSDGEILGLGIVTHANLGAYTSQFGPFVPTMAGSAMLVGCYRFQAIHIRVRGIYTNTQPTDAYRGAGRPEATYLVERTVDHVARILGLGPDEIRLKNFVRAEEMPYATPTGLVYDSGDFARNLHDAKAMIDWAGFEARRAEAASRGRYRGIGMSSYIERCAGGSGEDAVVTVGRDGRITVAIGTQTNGQGHETAYKQIVSHHLGVDADSITVIQGDTDLVATGGGTGGSRSVPVGGAALADGAIRIRDRAKERAAELLEASVQDIEFSDGRFTIAGTDRTMTFEEVAERAETEIAFEETGRFDPDAATYPNGTHIAEVEVDPETGRIEVLRYVVADDFGAIVNPQMVLGQIHGGVAQGLGQALLEYTAFDDTGQLLAGSFMDYAMPRADHLPFIDVQFNEDIPCRTNPLGLKGAGEAGAIGAPPSIINALIDALSPIGVETLEMPVTPLALWQAIQAATASRAAE